MCDQTTNTGAAIRAGSILALAVTSPRRLAGMPDLPTMAEAGVRGLELSIWHGLFAPAGTPPAIVAKLSGEIQRILHSPKISERLQGMGAKPIGNTPEEFAQFISAERKKWAEVIQTANITVEG
jgi:tripartite-type tricarboxylate transporter receptor subunit TctC